VWLYEECYLRFALTPWAADNFGDRLAHLCNNCVQREGDGSPPAPRARLPAAVLVHEERTKEWSGSTG